MWKYFFRIFGVKIIQVEILKELKNSFECICKSQGENFCVL